MRNTLFVLGLAAGLGLTSMSGAGAVPIDAAGVKQAAAAASPLQQAQYAEYRSRRGGIVKCFREFVIGPYICHWYPL